MTESKPSIERVKPPKWFIRRTNPILRGLAKRLPGLARSVLVLHFTGRKSGRRFDVPIGYRLEDGRIQILTDSVWRHNFTGGRGAEVTYLCRRQPAEGTLADDPAELADYYMTQTEAIGAKRVASDLGMRINLDRAPTHAEWMDALQRVGMARVWVDLREKSGS